jgi:aspartyl-tRNA(Asn)/glutamyl-tRNA(Gln) amidotransferase subunit C
MKISIKEVEHIAALARLKLTNAEKRRYSEQLSEILDYAAKLDELDTDDIPPTNSVLKTELRLREDQPHPGLSQQDLLRNAPKKQDGQLQVPPVLGD